MAKKRVRVVRPHPNGLFECNGCGRSLYPLTPDLRDARVIICVSFLPLDLFGPPSDLRVLVIVVP